jgi:magnesium-transporting ATPase (P-type)
MFDNKFLNICTALSLAILIAVMYIPFLREMFTVTVLNISQMGVCLAFIAAVLVGSELSEKFFK